MLRILHSFLQIGYEPMCVLAGLGILCFFFEARKERKMSSFALLCAFLLWMFFWRFSIHKFLFSSRYCAIVILPVILYGAYFWKRFSKYAISGCILFCVINLIQTLHVNVYDSTFRDAGLAVRNDSAHYPSPVVVSFCKEARRLEYYSALPVLELAGESKSTLYPPYLNANVRSARLFGKTVYFAFNLPKGTEPPTARRLGVRPEEWSMIYRSFRNRKKKLEFMIYRYTPSAAGTARTDLPKKQEKNVERLLTCDFENVYYISSGLAKIFTDRKFTFFMKNGIRFCDDFIIEAKGCAPSADFEAEAAENTPISGKFSLRLKSQRSCRVYSKDRFLVKSPVDMTFRVRADKPACVILYADCFTGEKGDRKFRTEPLTALYPDGGKVYEFTQELLPEEYKNGQEYVRFGLDVRFGEIWIDDITAETKQERKFENAK